MTDKFASMSMSMTEQERRLAEFERVFRSEVMPNLIALRHQILLQHLRPTGVVLPASMNPGPREGEGSTDDPATIFGLPVTWGDHVGMIVAADG